MALCSLGIIEGGLGDVVEQQGVALVWCRLEEAVELELWLDVQ